MMSGMLLLRQVVRNSSCLPAQLQSFSAHAFTSLSNLQSSSNLTTIQQSQTSLHRQSLTNPSFCLDAQSIAALLGSSTSISPPMITIEQLVSGIPPQGLSSSFAQRYTPQEVGTFFSPTSSIAISMPGEITFLSLSLNNSTPDPHLTAKA